MRSIYRRIALPVEPLPGIAVRLAIVVCLVDAGLFAAAALPQEGYAYMR